MMLAKALLRARVDKSVINAVIVAEAFLFFAFAIH